MPLTQKPIHIFEPTSLQCGQAVLAMLSDLTVNEIIDICKTDRETTLKDMKESLKQLGITYYNERKIVKEKSELPKIAILSLETPHCWHWSLYYDGIFYDPEYGLLEDFPPSVRRYYWEIKED